MRESNTDDAILTHYDPFHRACLPIHDPVALCRDTDPWEVDHHVSAGGCWVAVSISQLPHSIHLEHRYRPVYTYLYQADQVQAPNLFQVCVAVETVYDLEKVDRWVLVDKVVREVLDGATGSSQSLIQIKDRGKLHYES